MDYDILFIGSGHANWHGATALAQAGKKVALIEKDLAGGTCSNYGCDAKILLDAPFQLTEQLAAYKGIGVDETPTITWENLMAYKHQVIDSLAPAMEGIFKQANVELLKGSGSIIDAHTVKVGEKTYTTETIVIGTGQRPAALPIPGKEFNHDSREFLSIETLPERMTFIGSGIIAMEFISMAAYLGKEIHVVEFADNALNMFNQKYVAKVVKKMTDAGVQFHFGEAVEEVAKQANGLFIVRTKNGLVIETDYVLGATGRVANIERLGLENIGIATDRGGIIVDDHLGTNVANIYASGDVISKTIPKLTPTAIFESNYIAGQILGSPEAIDYPVAPSVVYTLPRIAELGVTVKEAEANPSDYRISVIPFGKLLTFEYKNELSAEATLIFNQENQLVGASIYGNESEELINLLPLIINNKMSAAEFRKQIFTFPGATSGLMDVLNLAFAGM